MAVTGVITPAIWSELPQRIRRNDGVIGVVAATTPMAGTHPHLLLADQHKQAAADALQPRVTATSPRVREESSRTGDSPPTAAGNMAGGGEVLPVAQAVQQLQARAGPEIALGDFPAGYKVHVHRTISCVNSEL